MDNNFEQLIASLSISSLSSDILHNIKIHLQQQNSILLPAFISEFYSSILTLQHWTWELLSQNSDQWTEEKHYLELFHTLAIFNKNLIFNSDNIEANIKASLLIPDRIDWINGIFKQIENSHNDNNPLISIASMWFDNLSSFLIDNPEFEASTTVTHINRYIARHYIMTDQYKSYLFQLRQSSLSESIFTAKQLFYIKTCSSSLSSYLMAKAQDFLYTSENIIRHFGPDYVQIIIFQTHTIDSWSSQLLTCITHLIVFFVSCCWWGGEKGPQARIVFPNELIACEYIDALIRIVDYKPLRQYIVAQRTNDQTILLDTTLFTLINIAQNQNFIWYLRSKILLPETLIAIAETSVYDKICLRVYGILAEILSSERFKELKISDSASIYFFKILEHAWRHPSKRFKQIPMIYLLKGLTNLSKIDAIQQKIANTNKVLLLIEMCDEYPVIFDILWALSFNHDIQQQLRSNSSFMIKLTHLPKEFNNVQMRKITQGILWNLESNHNDRTISEISNKKTFEIMISYSHQDEIVCRQIYNELINVGYRVWIDFDQMHGNVMDAMAQAIERSNIILICISEQYHRSNYCRAEAHYAFQRQLRIVPILLQEHYQPDGWLLFLVSQVLYVDFTKYEFSQAIQMLIKELKAPIIDEISIVHVCSKVEDNTLMPITPVALKIPENILEWDQIHVQHWLTSHGLLQMSRLFANLDGQSLLYMHEHIEHLDSQQVISLLNEDSLRRTSQSLSLVELSYFRSLINQQKQSLTSSSLSTKHTKPIIMGDNMEDLVAKLTTTTLCDDILCKIINIFQNIDNESLLQIISDNFNSLFILEHWAWKILSSDSYQWINQSKYFELFNNLASFNKKLIFTSIKIDSEKKASLLIPQTKELIKDIFEQIEKHDNDNDSYFIIISLWLDNLSYFMYEDTQYLMSTIITDMEYVISSKFVMVDQYKFYLNQLHHSILTYKQLFYLRTCSFFISSYLFCKHQKFPFTGDDILRYLADDYLELIEFHSFTIQSWNKELLSCITHLINFICSCCSWGSDREKCIKILLPSIDISHKYIQSLIRIIGYKPFYEQIQVQRSNDETILIDVILNFLLAISEVCDLVCFMRYETKLLEILLLLVETSKHIRINLYAYGMLGQLLSDEHLKELKITNNISEYFFYMLEHAWNHPEHNFQRTSVPQLLRGFLNLAKNDSIQQNTADTNRITLFFEMCDEYPLVYDIIWALSFNHDIQQQLRSNRQLMFKLTHLKQELNNPQMRKIANGIVWNLESLHEDRAVSEENAEIRFDIMISYSHNDKTLCKQIYDELIKSGYRVWIDFNQMHGNIMDAMAQAIEHSNVILICMSEQYRR
ncbi:unnamed protein product, partial [Adineta steineri]